MLNILSGIFASSGFGAVVGLFGSWLTKREERKNQKLKFDHDVKMAEIRRLEAAAEAEHELALADKKIELKEKEGEIAADLKELDAFKEGLEEQKKMYGIKIVDLVRGLMRPIITIYLLIIATYVAINIGRIVGGLGALTAEELATTYKGVINQLIFLTATAVTWWFGSRPSSQRKG